MEIMLNMNMLHMVLGRRGTMRHIIIIISSSGITLKNIPPLVAALKSETEEQYYSWEIYGRNDKKWHVKNCVEKYPPLMKLLY